LLKNSQGMLKLGGKEEKKHLSATNEHEHGRRSRNTQKLCFFKTLMEQGLKACLAGERKERKSAAVSCSGCQWGKLGPVLLQLGTH